LSINLQVCKLAGNMLVAVRSNLLIKGLTFRGWFFFLFEDDPFPVMGILSDGAFIRT
jgi:hypothetical protein